MNKRKEKILEILSRDSNETDEEIIFDKNDIIDDIKDNLPEPWMWFTINTRMVSDNAYIPSVSNMLDVDAAPFYDLLITKRISFPEQKNFINQLSVKNTGPQVYYNIILGININEERPRVKQNHMLDELVTLCVNISSPYELFDILEEIDASQIGIKQ
jgi:hypothetical protein